MAMPHILSLLAVKGEAAPALRPEAPPSHPERFRGLRLRPSSGAPARPAPAAAKADNVVTLALPAAERGRRVGVTLRLDVERHGLLRRFAAEQGRSMQSILSEALERYIAERGGWS